ncbi:zinc-binding dehydrogenase [Natronosporangium hydrolyticum]|uniref:Zinc-binding dehydrogenase n=1 Tax=Natronosporangium hydrolyticum TaxID=2811111 RepID=A0A895YI50_9ACTN|nr:zinc-binding dehydrogenase [Natronosporangium hydrolyticum]QSB15705.1 zinc-binding dehydrogenase [Natronosporangium hydrolyticum]
MRAVFASAFHPDDPLAGLVVGERPEPVLPAPDWVTVEVRASSLNHHDLWSLRGVGLAEAELPMILGCDAAGVDEHGNEVVVHAVIGSPVRGDETLDPRRSLLSEHYQGTMADRVVVPAQNLLPKPAGLSFPEAACAPTAWLTAYRMLTTRGGVGPDQAVLVVGAGGGVATAAVVLAQALGARVYGSSRDPEKRERVAELGAITVEPGARLPERVDVVIETVGAATLEHSIKSTKPGGRIVVSGATSGHAATVDLRRIFFLQQQLLGSTMGTRTELSELLELMAGSKIRPVVDTVFPFPEARSAFARLASGEVFGKLVLDHTAS